MGMDRKQETTAVKRALVSKGFENNNIRVTHGKGTAWGWLHIDAKLHHKPDCDCVEYSPVGDVPRQLGQRCQDLRRECYDRITQIAQDVTGRHGEYDGRVGVNLHFFDK